MRDERTQAILERLQDGLLSARILDNTIRGLWCEYMVANALGDECQAVGLGWNAWDLQIGRSDAEFPNRIRIQVKNSARLQVWSRNGHRSYCQFELKYRRKPFYFHELNNKMPCEDSGFLCDIYILCYHPIEDEAVADQLDVDQWLFYLAPVVGPNAAVTASEVEWAAATLDKTGRPAACIRRPDTLEKGIRGRPAIRPVSFAQLTLPALRRALGLPAQPLVA